MRRCVIDCRLMSMDVADWCARRNHRVSRLDAPSTSPNPTRCLMHRRAIDRRLMSMNATDRRAQCNRRVSRIESPHIAKLCLEALHRSLSRLDAPSTSPNPIRCLMPRRTIDRRLMSMNATDRRAQCNRRVSRIESPHIAKLCLEALHRSLSRLESPSTLTNPIRRLMHRCAIDRRLMSMDTADRCTRRNHRVSHVDALCIEASHCASPSASPNPILRRTIDRRLTSMNAADRRARHNHRASHIESPSTSPTPIHRAIDSFNCRSTIDNHR